MAKDFKKQLNDISIPFSDLYIQIPCYAEKQINDNSYIDNLSFLKNMESTSNIEFTDSFCGDINRVFLDRVYIVIEEKVQISDVYLTIHNSTKLGVLTFMMPAIAVDSIKVLHNMSLNSIKIRKESSNSEDSIKTWLSDYYIDVYGSARAIIFTLLKPSEKELLSLLACEQLPEQYNLTSEQFNKFAGKNLGQYDSSEIYASENFLIVIQQNFDDNFTDRVVRQSLTLFISEILQLQDAAVSKVDSLIRNEIYETRNYALKKDSLKVLEKLVNESCQSIMLWDIRNFKFGTSRYLADNISNAFGIERILQNQINNKMRLEQLINIHNASINELENKNINKLLLLLAMLQVIPTLYSVSLSFLKHELDGGNYISALSSMAICFILWLIFSIRTSVEKRKKIFDK